MKWQSTCQAQLLPMALTGLMLAAPIASAQTPAQKREAELLQRVERSEARAATLQKRIEMLESRVETLKAAFASTPQQAGSMLPQPSMMRTSLLAQASPPPAPSSGTSGNSASSAARSGPGAFEVDEAAAQRALERTLTQTGALLLPTRTFEISPTFRYSRLEQSSPFLTTARDPVTSAPSLVLANERNRRNDFSLSLDLKAGLPLESQLEASLPYNWVRTSQVDDFGQTSSANASGVGDATLGIAKTFVREHGWRPDLIGRVTYNFGNGKKQVSGVNFSSGFRQLQGEVVALKRQDPLAFVVSASYSKVYESDSFKPGDAASLSLATVLAASPATSLQFGFSQIYRRKPELNGVAINGADQTYGIMSIGASSVLSRDVTLVTQFGIGLGNDAPKYNIGIALPILFR